MTPDARSRSSISALAVRLLGAAAAATAAAACGGAAEPTQSPKSEPQGTKEEQAPEPRTVEEAQDQIARARAQLEVADGAKSGGARKSAESPAQDAPPPPPAAPTQPQPGQSRRPEAASDACGGPCRALGSMRRAVDALCRMTGDSDKRCVEAKKTLTDSATRLSTCQCEAP